MRRILKAAGMSVLLGALVVLMGCDGSGSPGTVTVNDVNGTWTIAIRYDDGYQETWIMELSQDGSTIAGISYEAGYRYDSAQITGTVSGNSVTMRETWPGNTDYIYTGTITADGAMSGSLDAEDGSDPGTWVGTRNSG